MVIVLTILFGVGGLFVLSGLCMVTSHVVTAPHRYARTIRMDAGGPLRPILGSLRSGVMLIIAGATLLMAGLTMVNLN